MKSAVDFTIDVRNYLYLIEELGGDSSALMQRYRALETLSEEQRKKSADWACLETDTLSAIDSIHTPHEPSDLDSIRSLRPEIRTDSSSEIPDSDDMEDKIAGAWLGRIAGCILGKPVEMLMKHKDSRAKLTEILKASNSWPLDGYVHTRTMEYYWSKEEGGVPSWYRPDSGVFRGRIDHAPADDDLNYTVLSLQIVKQHGLDFTSDKYLDLWLSQLPFDAVCTAEKLAYRNRVMGLSFPDTASFHNPYCEWIGAQIRTDFYGYILPGNMEHAAQLGFADAAASHLRNGIYGAMWVSAANAAAFVETDPVAVIQSGLEQIPRDSRLAVHLRETVREALANGDNFEKTFDSIQSRLAAYHCVHTVNNACVVAAALIHGRGDFGKTICIAVMGGMDTDCNGATAGSIAGILAGKSGIDPQWYEPFNNTLHTSLGSRHLVQISDLIAETVALQKQYAGELSQST